LQPPHRVHLHLREAHDGVLVRRKRGRNALLHEFLRDVRELFHGPRISGVDSGGQRLRLVAGGGVVIVSVLVVHALEEVLKNQAHAGTKRERKEAVSFGERRGEEEGERVHSSANDVNWGNTRLPVH
jgi:hypothetical protein